MAIVIKVSTKELYRKCTSITKSVKDLQQQIYDINALEKELLSRFWAGDVADKCIKEYLTISEETGPIIVSLMGKPLQLLKMAEMYDEVEGFNIVEEASKLPKDFLS